MRYYCFLEEISTEWTEFSKKTEGKSSRKNGICILRSLLSFRRKAGRKGRHGREDKSRENKIMAAAEFTSGLGTVN